MDNQNNLNNSPSYSPTSSTVPDTGTSSGVEASGGHDPKKAIVSALIIVVVLVASYILWTWIDKGQEASGPRGEGMPAEGVTVTRLDLTSRAGDRLLPGFPSDIPVEEDNLTESYSAVYASQGLTQHTVSYESAKQPAVLWEEYRVFMTNAGYPVDEEVSDKAVGFIKGVWRNLELSVVISPLNGGSHVQINYIER